jgi:deazaflavin-dependent oxidoreductase (nitroreductase family)
MLLTHTGRKTGKQYAIPIAYLRDGETILANAMSSEDNWYHNIQQNPSVTLEIKGERIPARAEALHETGEVAKALAVYQRKQPRVYGFFGVPREMPPEAAACSPKLRVKFVRFHPGK